MTALDPGVRKIVAEAEEAMAPARCWLWHRWTKWQDRQGGQLTKDGKVIGVYIRQERRCLLCNRVSLRMADAIVMKLL